MVGRDHSFYLERGRAAPRRDGNGDVMAPCTISRVDPTRSTLYVDRCYLSRVARGGKPCTQGCADSLPATLYLIRQGQRPSHGLQCRPPRRAWLQSTIVRPGRVGACLRPAAPSGWKFLEEDSVRRWLPMPKQPPLQGAGAFSPE